MSEQLKTCPFCGNAPSYGKELPKSMGSTSGSYPGCYVGCHAHTKFMRPELWNRRPALVAATEERDAALELVDGLRWEVYRAHGEMNVINGRWENRCGCSTCSTHKAKEAKA